MGRFRENYQKKLAAFKDRQVKLILPKYQGVAVPNKTMVSIPLTNHQVALVDVGDEPLIRQHAWAAKFDRHSGNWYASRTERVDGKRRMIFMHREILGITDPEIKVDHWSCDGLDNRRKNLRTCDESQNGGNARKRKTGKTSSAFKGVSLEKASNKFRASVMRDGIRYYLGCFADEESAARAYDDAARAMFGEFARCNFPKPEAIAELAVSA